jgi:hypothetical protein
MNNRHRKILAAVYADPPRANIPWEDIEALLIGLGAERYQGNGSRVRFILNGIKATFHRPHPRKETERGALLSVRRFLQTGGIRP